MTRPGSRILQSDFDTVESIQVQITSLCRGRLRRALRRHVPDDDVVRDLVPNVAGLEHRGGVRVPGQRKPRGRIGAAVAADAVLPDQRQNLLLIRIGRPSSRAVGRRGRWGPGRLRVRRRRRRGDQQPGRRQKEQEHWQPGAVDHTAPSCWRDVKERKLEFMG